MRMPYDVNLPATLSEKLSGGERSLLIKLIVPVFLFFLVSLASCSRHDPILSKGYLPESFDLTKVNRSDTLIGSPSLTIINVNDSIELSERIVEYWKHNKFAALFEKEHPVLKYNRSDIAVLKEAITRLFKIYYIDNKSPVIISKTGLNHEIIVETKCSPLSNHEIQFMMNSGIEDAFPRKALTMLVISSYELMASIGAKPVYPKVYSPYLRKKYNLPHLSSLEDSNLFATKIHNDVYSANISGFIFCRKSR